MVPRVAAKTKLPSATGFSQCFISIFTKDFNIQAVGFFTSSSYLIIFGPCSILSTYHLPPPNRHPPLRTEDAVGGGATSSRPSKRRRQAEVLPEMKDVHLGRRKHSVRRGWRKLGNKTWELLDCWIFIRTF